MKLPEKQDVKESVITLRKVSELPVGLKEKEKSTNIICYEFEEFRRRNKTILTPEGLNKMLCKKWVASEDVLAFLKEQEQKKIIEMNDIKAQFIQEWNDREKYWLERIKKTLENQQTEWRGKVEQLQKEIDKKIEEISNHKNNLSAYARRKHHVSINILKKLKIRIIELFGCEKPMKELVKLPIKKGLVGTSVVGSQNHLHLKEALQESNKKRRKEELRK